MDWNTNLIILKCRAQSVADAASLLYWMPDRLHHQEVLKREMEELRSAMELIHETVFVDRSEPADREVR